MNNFETKTFVTPATFDQQLEKASINKSAIDNIAYLTIASMCDHGANVYMDKADGLSAVIGAYLSNHCGYMVIPDSPIRSEVNDGVVGAEFNASEFFRNSLNRGTLKQDLEALIECDFKGENYPASIAYYFSDSQNRGLYQHHGLSGPADCTINKQDVRAWLEAFAPEYRTLMENSSTV